MSNIRNAITNVVFSVRELCSEVTHEVVHYFYDIPFEISTHMFQTLSFKQNRDTDYNKAKALRVAQHECEALTAQEIEEKIQQRYFSVRLHEIQNTQRYIHKEQAGSEMAALSSSTQEYTAAQQLLVRNVNATSVLHKFLGNMFDNMCEVTHNRNQNVHTQDDMHYVQLLLDHLVRERFSVLYQTLPASMWPQTVANEALQMLHMLARVQCHDYVADITHIFHAYAENAAHIAFFHNAQQREPFAQRIAEIQNAQIHEDKLNLLRMFTSLIVQTTTPDLLFVEFNKQREILSQLLSESSNAYRVLHAHRGIDDAYLSTVMYDMTLVKFINSLHSLCLYRMLLHYETTRSLTQHLDSFDHKYVSRMVLLHYDAIVNKIALQVETYTRACIILYMLRNDILPSESLEEKVYDICSLFRQNNRQLGGALSKEIAAYASDKEQIAQIIYDVLVSCHCDVGKMQQQQIEDAADKIFCQEMQQDKYCKYLHTYVTNTLCNITLDIRFMLNLRTLYEKTDELCRKDIKHTLKHNLDIMVGHKHSCSFKHAIQAAQTIERREYNCFDVHKICHEAGKLQPNITLNKQVNLLQAMHMYTEDKHLSQQLCLHLYVDGAMIFMYEKLANWLYYDITTTSNNFYRIVMSNIRTISIYYVLKYIYNICI